MFGLASPKSVSPSLQGQAAFERVKPRSGGLDPFILNQFCYNPLVWVPASTPPGKRLLWFPSSPGPLMTRMSSVSISPDAVLRLLHALTDDGDQRAPRVLGVDDVGL